MKIALISLGNTFRRDDGIAWFVCNRLSANLDARIEWFDLGVHGNRVASYIEDATAVIVVDALLARQSTGSVDVVDMTSLTADVRTIGRTSHGLSWIDELSLLRTTKPIMFIGINVEDDGWGCGFSADLQASIPHIVDRVQDVCLEMITMQEICALESASA